MILVKPKFGMGVSSDTAGSMTPERIVVTDALFRAYGIRHIDMPTTPLRIWAAIRNAKVK